VISRSDRRHKVISRSEYECGGRSFSNMRVCFACSSVLPSLVHSCSHQQIDGEKRRSADPMTRKGIGHGEICSVWRAGQCRAEVPSTRRWEPCRMAVLSVESWTMSRGDSLYASVGTFHCGKWFALGSQKAKWVGRGTTSASVRLMGDSHPHHLPGRRAHMMAQCTGGLHKHCLYFL
jgi:hypothetical protein